MYEFWREIPINFFTEKVDVNIYNIRFCIKVDIPYIEGYIRSGKNFIFISDKIFEQLKFFRSEGNWFSVSADFFAVQMHHQVGYGKRTARSFFVLLPFQKSIQPGKKLFKIKRLYEIIISSGIESGQLVIRGSHGSQHNHQNLVVYTSNIMTKLIPGHQGEPDIEYRQVVMPFVK